MKTTPPINTPWLLTALWLAPILCVLGYVVHTDFFLIKRVLTVDFPQVAHVLAGIVVGIEMFAGWLIHKVQHWSYDTHRIGLSLSIKSWLGITAVALIILIPVGIQILVVDNRFTQELELAMVNCSQATPQCEQLKHNIYLQKITYFAIVFFLPLMIALLSYMAGSGFKKLAPKFTILCATVWTWIKKFASHLWYWVSHLGSKFWQWCVRCFLCVWRMCTRLGGFVLFTLLLVPGWCFWGIGVLWHGGIQVCVWVLQAVERIAGMIAQPVLRCLHSLHGLWDRLITWWRHRGSQSKLSSKTTEYTP